MPQPQPSMPTQAPKAPTFERRIEKVINRVMELIQPYLTTGYAGQAHETIKKHNQELDQILQMTEDGMPTTDQQILNQTTME